jgi:hypothetical protein
VGASLVLTVAVGLEHSCFATAVVGTTIASTAGNCPSTAMEDDAVVL